MPGSVSAFLATHALAQRGMVCIRMLYVAAQVAAVVKIVLVRSYMRVVVAVVVVVVVVVVAAAAAAAAVVAVVVVVL